MTKLTTTTTLALAVPHVHESTKRDMQSLRLTRYALAIGAATALLAGCGGSQQPISGPGAMPQSRATTTQARHGKSWMLPEARGEDLIYATGPCGGVCVVSYSKGKLVGMIALTGGFIGGACSDAEGNVFVANNSQVLEFAHGGTTPIETLPLPGTWAYGCSVDPMTGNLAVTFIGTSVNLAIFPSASGTPAFYNTDVGEWYCGYDNAGNLFASGHNGQPSALSELPRGGTQFTILAVNGNLGQPGQVQWDGNHIAYEGVTGRNIRISRLSISGSSAKVIGATQIKNPAHAGQSWIAGNRVIVPYSTKEAVTNRLGLWQYPKSGKVVVPYGDLGQPKESGFVGATLSVAPQRAP